MSSKDIKEYIRDAWTLADLRDLVDATDDWNGSAVVKLTAPNPQSIRGVIEVEK